MKKLILSMFKEAFFDYLIEHLEAAAKSTSTKVDDDLVRKLKAAKSVVMASM